MALYRYIVTKSRAKQREGTHNDIGNTAGKSKHGNEDKYNSTIRVCLLIRKYLQNSLVELFETKGDVLK